MHYRAITDKALELGWLVSEGKTPEASMHAQILMESKAITAVGSNLASFSMAKDMLVFRNGWAGGSPLKSNSTTKKGAPGAA